MPDDPGATVANVAASTVRSTAVLTAQNWWYFATFFSATAPPSPLNTTKLRTRSRNRALSNTPRTRTSTCGISPDATSVPSIVFHGA